MWQKGTNLEWRLKNVFIFLNGKCLLSIYDYDCNDIIQFEGGGDFISSSQIMHDHPTPLTNIICKNMKPFLRFLLAWRDVIIENSISLA